MNMNKRDPIEKYYPPVRVLNCLKRAKLNTVGDVITAHNGTLYSACPTAEDQAAVCAFANKLDRVYARKRGVNLLRTYDRQRGAWLAVLAKRA